MPYRDYAQPPPTPMERLQDLGDHLRELAVRVREAVAEAVGETLSRLARDAARQWLGHPAKPDPYSGDYDRHRDDADPWADDEPEDDYGPPMTARQSSAGTTGARRTLLSGLLWAAGWCLRKRCPPLAAIAATLAAMTTGGWRRSDSPAVDVLGAVAEVLALQRALNAGSAAPDPI